MNLLLPPDFASDFAPDFVLPTGTGTLAQQQPPDNPGGQGEDFGKSSPVGLVVMLLFFVAVVLLVRSMNKHLRRLPESFDPPRESARESPRESSRNDPGTDDSGDR